jgi:hypothetical protein
MNYLQMGALRDLAKKLKARAKQSSKKPPDSCTLPLFLKNEQEIIAPFSSEFVDAHAVINEKIMDYLEARADCVPPGSKIIIAVSMRDITAKTLALMESLVKKELEEKIFKLMQREKRGLAVSVLFGLAGLLVLSLVHVSPIANRYVFHELFVVMSWVFVWSGCESFFFDRPRARIKLMKLARLYLAEWSAKRNCD